MPDKVAHKTKSIRELRSVFSIICYLNNLIIITLGCLNFPGIHTGFLLSLCIGRGLYQIILVIHLNLLINYSCNNFEVFVWLFFLLTFLLTFVILDML